MAIFVSPGTTNLESQKGEKILSAQLKVYWKPELSVIREHGGFRTRIYDVIKPEVESMLDVKKISHKCVEEDEGENVFIL